jgi:hypothetical protein
MSHPWAIMTPDEAFALADRLQQHTLMTSMCWPCANAALHVTRAKNGTPPVHPLQGDELRALRELQRQFPDSGYVFTSEQECAEAQVCRRYRLKAPEPKFGMPAITVKRRITSSGAPNKRTLSTDALGVPTLRPST